MAPDKSFGLALGMGLAHLNWHPKAPAIVDIIVSVAHQLHICTGPVPAASLVERALFPLHYSAHPRLLVPFLEASFALVFSPSLPFITQTLIDLEGTLADIASATTTTGTYEFA